MKMPDGTLIAREKGTPQGSPISPLLANLFMHHAFDRWMVRERPGCPFERYADDIVAHECGTNRGGLCSRSQLLSIGIGVGEVGVPAAEVVGQVVVEDPGADLEQQVGAAGGPAHLLALDHALGDHLVDG